MIGLTLAVSLALVPQPQSVEVRTLYSCWEFRRGDEAAWTKVCVPHDWAIGGPFHETNDLQIAKIEQDGVAVKKIAKKMTDICHRMDPTRPVVFVTDRPDAYTESGAIQVTDVPALTYRLPRYGFMHELPKDRMWLYRSRWRTDAPTLHVLPEVQSLVAS